MIVLDEACTNGLVIHFITGIRMGVSTPMADRQYAGFSGTSERTTRRVKCRYKTFASDNNHAIYTQDRGVFEAQGIGSEEAV